MKLKLKPNDFVIDYLLDYAEELQQPKDLVNNMIHHKYEIEERVCNILNGTVNLENIKDYILPEHKRFLRYAQKNGDIEHRLDSWKFKQTCSTSFEFYELAKTKILIDEFQPTLSNYATVINKETLKQDSYNQLIFLLRVIVHQTVRMLVYTFFKQTALKNFAEDYAQKQNKLFLYCLTIVNVPPLSNYNISDYLSEFHVYKCPEYVCKEHRNYVEKRNELSAHKCSQHNRSFVCYGNCTKQEYMDMFK